MKLFLIHQSQNDNLDSYDSAVVAAPNKETAKHMHPSTGKRIIDWSDMRSWCNGPEHVHVEYIGDADNSIHQGVVCSSFNAG